MITRTVYRGKKWDIQSGGHILTGWGTSNWLRMIEAEPLEETAKDVPQHELDATGKWIDPEGLT